MEKQTIEEFIKEIRQYNQDQEALHKDYRKKLDDHIEIYKANGESLKSLAASMVKMEKKQEAMYQVYLGFNWSTKALIWILGLIATVIAIVMGIRNL